MNRKLHNTTMALIASSSLFVLGLLTSTPTVPSQSPTPVPVAAASFDADTAMASEARATESGQTAAHRPTRRTSRQSVAMPFFSFAPRG